MDALNKALQQALGTWTLDDDVVRFEEAAHKIASASSSDPYTGYYLRNIVRGKQPLTARVSQHCESYLSLQNGAGHGEEKDQTIQPAPDVSVVEGSIVLESSRLCICGQWFIPRAGNQIHHSHACKLLARKRRRQRRARERR